ncbi:tumor necrosis factor receptor superfamily member 6 [Amphiprion ocellaris]|uniref:tumor necrosis factor receptor superfamily member 6 n=1 Tax=Amphiprion ocellaris TaxID=80972 RepID=UPI000C30D235|nr:tumor necrosis factor receptor superfamily member 6 [Amphiprion ocellaris]
MFSSSFFQMFSWLLGVSLLCGLSLSCTDQQYSWPSKMPRLCCPKCEPGTSMAGRSEDTCDKKCEPCEGNQFMDSYNVEMDCNDCRKCDQPNMEVKTRCNSTQDTVCSCLPGYRCTDEPCSMCVPIPTAADPTEAPPTTASTPGPLTTLLAQRAPIRDTVWFLAIIVLLCAGIAVAVVTKIKPILRWFRSRYGYFLAEKPAAQDEDNVSKPVQEVCGKCEQLMDICVKD